MPNLAFYVFAVNVGLVWWCVFADLRTIQDSRLPSSVSDLSKDSRRFQKKVSKSRARNSTEPHFESSRRPGRQRLRVLFGIRKYLSVKALAS